MSLPILVRKLLEKYPNYRISEDERKILREEGNEFEVVAEFRPTGYETFFTQEELGLTISVYGIPEYDIHSVQTLLHHANPNESELDFRVEQGVVYRRDNTIVAKPTGFRWELELLPEEIEYLIGLLSFSTGAISKTLSRLLIGDQKKVSLGNMVVELNPDYQFKNIYLQPKDR